jgi:hypothetical protein
MPQLSQPLTLSPVYQAALAASPPSMDDPVESVALSAAQYLLGLTPAQLAAGPTSLEAMVLYVQGYAQGVRAFTPRRYSAGPFSLPGDGTPTALVAPLPVATSGTPIKMEVWLALSSAAPIDSYTLDLDPAADPDPADGLATGVPVGLGTTDVALYGAHPVTFPEGAEEATVTLSAVTDGAPTEVTGHLVIVTHKLEAPA